MVSFAFVKRNRVQTFLFIRMCSRYIYSIFKFRRFRLTYLPIAPVMFYRAIIVDLRREYAIAILSMY